MDNDDTSTSNRQGEPGQDLAEATAASGKPSALPVSIRWVLVLALLFRLGMATQPTVHQADEVWQYLEPAYGWVTGRWIVAWEFHADIRGWLAPALFYPFIWLGHWIAPETQLHILLVRMFLGVASMGVVLTFVRLGQRFSHVHTLVAAWVACLWVEIFFFAGRTSSEAMAVSLIVPAIGLGYRIRQSPSHSLTAAAGLLLGLGTVLRFQYLPATALIGLWIVWPAPRKSLVPLLLGGFASLVIGGLADLIAGHTPYAWMVNNFAINFTEGRSELFGTSSPWWFFTELPRVWGWTGILIVPAIVMGARRLPFLLVVASSILASHSFIAHKEYRFALLAIVVLLLLAAIGSVDSLRALQARIGSVRLERRQVPILLALWFAMSLCVALTNPFGKFWGAGRVYFTALAKAGETPGLCGLAIYRPRAHPFAAYTYINRDVPIFLFDGPVASQSARANAGAFNVAMAPRIVGGELPEGFRLVDCKPDNPNPAKQKYCTYVRPGTCTGSAQDFEYNQVIARLGH